MAFVVEDGTGLADANSYLSVADFTSYHDDRGTDTSAYETEDLETALVRATDFVERTYGLRFKGYPTNTEQRLHFPASSICDRFGREVDPDAIPGALQNAIAEYALRALTQSLDVDPVYSEADQKITKTRKKVGPLEVETEYDEGSSSIVITRRYPAADKYLRPLLVGSRINGGGAIRY